MAELSCVKSFILIEKIIFSFSINKRHLDEHPTGEENMKIIKKIKTYFCY